MVTFGQSSDKIGVGKYSNDKNERIADKFNLRAEIIGPEADRRWRDELKSKGTLNSRLWIVLYRLMWMDYLKSLGTCLAVRLFLQLAGIELLRHLLFKVEEWSLLAQTIGEQQALTWDDNLSLWTIEGLAHYLRHPIVEIALITIGSQVFFALYTCGLPLVKVSTCRAGLKSRILLTQLIRRKSMRVHRAASVRDSSSRALGLISNEVDHIEEAHKYLMFILAGPICFLVSTAWAAITQIGWKPILSAYGLASVFVAIQMYLPKIGVKISTRRQQLTNKRIGELGMVLDAIKITKLYHWETNYIDRINRSRQREHSYLMKANKLTAIDSGGSLLYCMMLLVLVLFVSVNINGHSLNGHQIIMVTIALTSWRYELFHWFPIGYRYFHEVMAALDRIKEYLITEEMTENGMVRLHSDQVKVLSRDFSLSLDEPGRESSPQMRPIIRSLDMELEKGDLLIVVGSVGSGKTSLLISLLGETRITSGCLLLSDWMRISYAAQEACIFSDSIRGNILCGRPMDLERYEKVLDACALRRDLKLMANGDETQVGTKGVALSGGQRARLNLARALYTQADVYLLDDPLSALDSRVAREVFQRAIREFLADKLVILATHQLQYLESATKIVKLSHTDRSAFVSVGQASDLHLMNDPRANTPAIFRQTSNQSAGSGDKPLAEKSDYSRGLDSVLESDSIGWYKAGAILLRMGLGLFAIAIISILGLVSLGMLIILYISLRDWVSASSSSDMPDQMQKLTGFLILSLATSFILILTCYLAAYFARRGAHKLHELMVTRLVRAKMSFYDYCDAGKLSSRYAGDFAILDHTFIFLFVVCLSHSVETFSTTITAIYLNPKSTVLFLGMFLLDIVYGGRRFPQLRGLMKEASESRAPLYTNISTTIDDIVTVRSNKDLAIELEVKFNEAQNASSAAYLKGISYEFGLKTTMGALNSLVASLALLVLFLETENLEYASLGTFIMVLLFSASSGPCLADVFSNLEISSASVANILALTRIEPEEAGPQPASAELSVPMLDDASSSAGRVTFRDVSLRYFADEPKPALSDLSFHIGAGERVGIVGRTGAGKSSIISLFFRLYPFEGSILIDDQDTKAMSLSELRQSLAVIPQDPVIFCDTLRNNLDPFNERSDEQIWQVLEVVNMKEFAINELSGGLESPLSEKGRNLSFGQRQLVCLARALLRGPKVLLIDEATANVDGDTDALIQSTISRHFAGITIITIAHRLNTVIDYDRIMVLDAGKIVEFDTPSRLLAQKRGHFKSMYEAAANQLKDNGQTN